MTEAFLRAYYEAYNSAQEARLAEFLAEDVILTSAHGEQRGREAYLSTYRQIISVFDDHMTPEEISITGDAAFVRITDHFTAKNDVADFLGRSFAKGDSFTLRLTGDYLLRDGKIATIDIQVAAP
jgi:ketosteroid isomerase-like protein